MVGGATQGTSRSRKSPFSRKASGDRAVPSTRWKSPGACNRRLPSRFVSHRAKVAPGGGVTQLPLLQIHLRPCHRHSPSSQTASAPSFAGTLSPFTAGGGNGTSANSSARCADAGGLGKGLGAQAAAPRTRSATGASGRSRRTIKMSNALQESDARRGDSRSQNGEGATAAGVERRVLGSGLPDEARRPLAPASKLLTTDSSVPS